MQKMALNIYFLNEHSIKGNNNVTIGPIQTQKQQVIGEIATKPFNYYEKLLEIIYPPNKGGCEMSPL